MTHNYYIYILTNKSHSTLYVGVTRNIPNRLEKHKESLTGFANRYNCDKLVYFEHFKYILDAIAREKQIKRWRRSKKDELIRTVNPEYNDLLAACRT